MRRFGAPLLGLLLVVGATGCCGTPEVAGLMAAATAAAAARASTADPQVAVLIDGVSESELRPAVEELSGAAPTTIDGKPFTFRTRSSEADHGRANIERWVYERMSSYGLDSVRYQRYPGAKLVYAGRNVIGEIAGTTHPDEIVIIGAHMDSRPWTGRSPGADDNASGVSALLYLARTFAGHDFDRTIRFAVFNAEENAPWNARDGDRFGSGSYATRAAAAGENIVAMIQADGLANNTGDIAEMYTRRPGDDPNGGDHAIVAMWQQAVQTYGIEGLTTKLHASGLNWSDHGAFWRWYPEVPAVLLIEDDSGDHPTWHTPADTIDTYNWPFYVAITRSLGAVAATEAGIAS